MTGAERGITPPEGEVYKAKRPRRRPTVAETEQQGPGFRIRVDNPDLLFEAIQSGVSGEVGKILLEKPVESLEVNVLSGLEDFNYLAKVNPDFTWEQKQNSGTERITTSVVKRYSGLTERGGNLIVTAPRGTRIVVSIRTGFGERIGITTGILEERFGDGAVQLAPAPKITRESFENTTADFTEFLEAYIKEFYKETKKPSPDEELVIKSPKQLLGERGRGRLRDMTTPEGLIGKIEIERPSVSFAEIGGQTNAKREIEGLAFALSNPDLYRKWGTKPPKGIILYGPPGTGKTLMARALASQANARFFHIEASDISSKWYGESEEIVKSIFELANASDEKTIVFFDEVDAVAPHRTGAHEATQRVLATLLENMDGIVAKENVVVVASTNRLDAIEPALLRAGRFDRWVEVPLPDEDGRRQIFEIHMRKAAEVAERDLFNHVNLDEVVAKTEKSSGADIAEIVRRSLEEKVREEGTTGQEPDVITTEDIIKEIKGYERTRETRRSIGFPTRSQQRDELQTAHDLNKS